MARARRMRVSFVCFFVLALAVGGAAAFASAVPADRIVLSYEGGHFRIVSRASVAKAVQPPDEAESEFSIVTRTASGELRYRRAIPDPRGAIHESFAPESIARTPAPGSAALSVVVPAVAAGDVLLLFGRASPSEASVQVASLAIPAAGPAIAPFGADDGTVVSVTKIVDRGPTDSHFNLVLVAEGFQQQELADFDARAQSSSPSSSRHHRSPISPTGSTSSASTSRPPVGRGLAARVRRNGISVATFLDAVACPSTRLLTLDFGRAQSLLEELVPSFDQALVIVNTPVWAGAGGTIAVSSIEPTWWTRIATHEVGHGFDLADEYDYGSCEQYHGAEPSEPNVTIDANRALGKWADLISPLTPFPTTSCASFCPGQPPAYTGEEVGLHEGARYVQCGPIGRPSAA